jgi:hypothetical protein
VARGCVDGSVCSRDDGSADIGDTGLGMFLSLEMFCSVGIFFLFFRS